MKIKLTGKTYVVRIGKRLEKGPLEVIHHRRTHRRNRHSRGSRDGGFRFVGGIS